MGVGRFLYMCKKIRRKNFGGKKIGEVFLIAAAKKKSVSIFGLMVYWLVKNTKKSQNTQQNDCFCASCVKQNISAEKKLGENIFSAVKISAKSFAEFSSRRNFWVLMYIYKTKRKSCFPQITEK